MLTCSPPWEIETLGQPDDKAESKGIALAACLQAAVLQLASAVEQAKLEAEILLAHTLNKPRSFLYAWPEYQLTANEAAVFKNYIDRRAQGEPSAYIKQSREFYSLEFIVNSATLIPRPETELLVEEILNRFQANENCKIADLGTGCGTIALSLACAKPNWQVHAPDISEAALATAVKNAQKMGIKNLSFISGSWCTALLEKEFNVIVSNPPYLAERDWERYAQGLKYEPKSALVSGWDGLDAIRCIINEAPTYLQRGGYLVLEHGFDQGKLVRSLLAETGFSNIVTRQDFANLERLTLGCYQ
jgi:release factor glutamine methyltransferase